MSDSQKKTIALGVAGAVLTAGASWLLVISPHMATRSQDRAAAALATQDAASKERQAQQLKATASGLNDLVDSVNKLTQQFPGQYDQGGLLSMIQTAAKTTHVTLKSVTPSVPVDPAAVDPTTGAVVTPPAAADGTTPADTTFPIAVARVDLIAYGSASNLITFMSDIENMDRPLLVDQMKMSGDGSDLTLTVSGKTYLTRPLEVPDSVKSQQ